MNTEKRDDQADRDRAERGTIRQTETQLTQSRGTIRQTETQLTQSRQTIRRPELVCRRG